MKSEYKSLKQLAAELGHHPASIRRIVEGRGFLPFRLREGSNKPLYLTNIDADMFKLQMVNERNNTVVPQKDVTENKYSGVYFIEIPSYEGVIRVKIGWSEKLAERFSVYVPLDFIPLYRTIIPDLRVKGIWPTRDSWCERAALKCAETLGIKIFDELFEFEDTNFALQELNDLFLKFGIENKYTS
jgi:hypothetical protein